MAYALAKSRIYLDIKHLIPVGKRDDFLKNFTNAVTYRAVSREDRRRLIERAMTKPNLNSVFTWVNTPQGDTYWSSRYFYFRSPRTINNPWTGGVVATAPKRKRKPLQVVRIPIG